ncbi:TPA: hypothetical protein ACKP36_003031 [Serratia marcescens]|uniref:hypothetical protein n=1 Tax=Serratia marcescens TaxID=615 RepID=UPI0038C61094
MRELLKNAIENLAIYSVTMRDSIVKFGDGINSLNINGISKKSQSFRRISKIEVIEMKVQGKDDSAKLFYSFHYEVGSRLVNPEDHESGDEAIPSMLCIEATFEAIYQAKKELEKNELEAFSAKNVGYNVWPYWREYLQSTCSRVGVNPIKVPFYHMTGESDLRTELVSDDKS